jgi:hypothetical protein
MTVVVGDPSSADGVRSYSIPGDSVTLVALGLWPRRGPHTAETLASRLDLIAAARAAIQIGSGIAIFSTR